MYITKLTEYEAYLMGYQKQCESNIYHTQDSKFSNILGDLVFSKERGEQ